jgi:spore germination cell wall hydrolase CwlJ-like protein
MVTTLTCIAIAVYFEARSESLLGQALVAETILNRVEDVRWPNTACKVVKQHRQFSFYSDGKSDKPRNKELYKQAVAIAEEALEGKGTNTGSLFFHASYVKPYWRHRFERIARVGRHIFYK